MEGLNFVNPINTMPRGMAVGAVVGAIIGVHASQAMAKRNDDPTAGGWLFGTLCSYLGLVGGGLCYNGAAPAIFGPPALAVTYASLVQQVDRMM